MKIYSTMSPQPTAPFVDVVGSLGRMNTLMDTVPAVGATGGRPREPLNLGHRTKWRGLFLPDP